MDRDCGPIGYGGVGRGNGVGRGRGVTLGVAVGDGVAVGVADGVTEGVTVGVAVSVGVTGGVAVGVGVGDGVAPAAQKISIDATWDASTVVAACQPNPVVPSVSVGKLRRALRTGNRVVCPAVSAWIIDVHLVRRIGRGSAAAHDKHQAIEVKRSRLACGPVVWEQWWRYCPLPDHR